MSVPAGDPVASGQGSAAVGGDNTGIISTGADATIIQTAQPIARSTYRQQVLRITPDNLVGRDAELAELAAFCEERDGCPYVWWQAPPWAGKSALMSWFVLHPPQGVRVASFFITARFRGQSDQLAFIDVLLLQLAEIAGLPISPSLSEVTREPDLLDMLDAAADACRREDQQLVLVVDGLDEDRGVTVGPEAHSIAALLPVRLPERVRIVVAGRPNPPVPWDVPTGHPLRTPGIVRPLAPSPQAEVIKGEALRELKHLLQGTRAEQDLLGLVAAAGGGLSGENLAELTGCSLLEIEDHLSAVSGRTFSSRASHWSPNSGPQVYVLAHEELQNIAVAYVGEARLEAYRQRLHAWAEGYGARGWPPETPEYLLRGYFSLLQTIGDMPRMVACCRDQTRQDRMLDLTGGDHTALVEITTVQDIICGQAFPDLLAMLRLAIICERLHQRNSNIPPSLPAVWATLGNPNRAESLARSIIDPDRQARALRELAEVVAGAGDLDRAESLARSINDPYRRAQALSELVGVVAGAGDLDRAEGLARSINDSGWKAEAVSKLVGVMAGAGDPDRAEGLARSITDPYCKAQALRELVGVMAGAGDLDRAESLAYSITDPYWEAQALIELVGASDLKRASFLTNRAESLARSISPSRQVMALSELAKAVAAAGYLDLAKSLVRTIDPSRQPWVLRELVGVIAAAGYLDRAESLVHSIANSSAKAAALTEIAKIAIAAGDLSRARDLINRAANLARYISGPTEKAVLVGMCIAAGDLARARDLTERAETHARSNTDPDQQAKVLIELAGVVAAANHQAWAESLVRSITDPFRQAQALTEMAKIAIAAGDLSRARDRINRAESLVRSITDPFRQAQELTALAGVLAAAGDLHRTREVTNRAESLVGSITDPSRQAHVLSMLARLVAGAGDLDKAEGLARSITSESLQAKALSKLAGLLAETGDLDRAEGLVRSITGSSWSGEDFEIEALRELARVVAGTGDLDRAEGLARSISDPHRKVEALSELVGAVAAAGDLDRAEGLVRSITDDSGWKVRALSELVGAVVAAGDLNRAEDLVHSITDPHREDPALSELVGMLTAAGHLNRAGILARSITDTYWKERAFTKLAKATSNLGRTESLPESTTSTSRKEPTLSELVKMIAVAGDRDQARVLTNQAESLVRSTTDPDWQAQMLVSIARTAEPLAARLLLSQMLTSAPWIVPLEALAVVEPAALLVIADDLISGGQ